MKIAHVVDSMEIGGAEMLVAQMCRAQRKRGYDPRVYAIGSAGRLGEQLKSEGFSVRANVGKHLSDSTATFYRVFKSTLPDVVHLHNPTPTIYAAIPARIAGVPRIISTRHSLVGSPHRVSVELRYALAARSCDWIVGICEATVENLKSLHMLQRRKIVRVYNGAIAMDRVPPEKCPPKDGLTLLFAGRLAPVKNLPLLLDAVRSALVVRPNLRLWIVGDGSERARLEQLARTLGIAGKVTFWGEQLEVAPFFCTADVFVMSSVSEGLPMALLQSMSAGLPAVVTDVGGMAEVVRLSGGGITVRSGDCDAMASAIVTMADNEDLRASFSQKAAEAFSSGFSLEAVVEQYASYYRDGARPASRIGRG